MSEQHARGLLAIWSELGTGVIAAVVTMVSIAVMGGVSLPIYIHYQSQKAIILAEQRELLATEQAEAERITAQEQARLEQEVQAEADCLAAEKEADRQEVEWMEQERLTADEEQARLDTETRAEAERIAVEQAEAAGLTRQQIGATSQQPAPSEGAVSSSASSTGSRQLGVEDSDDQAPWKEPTSGVGKEMAEAMGAVWDPDEENTS